MSLNLSQIGNQTGVHNDDCSAYEGQSKVSPGGALFSAASVSDAREFWMVRLTVTMISARGNAMTIRGQQEASAVCSFA